MKLPFKRVLVSLPLAALLCQNAPALARQAPAGGAASSTQKRAATPAERPRTSPGRTKALAQIHAFVERARSFQDITQRIDGLVALASILWQDGGDAEYARQVFVDAHNCLKTFRPVEAQAAPTGAAATNGGASSQLSSKALRLLRRRLLTNLAKFDAPLANRLAAEQDGYFETPLAADEVKEQTREQVARQDFDKFSSA